MSASKTIIKELRKEIRELSNKLEDSEKHLVRQKRHIQRMETAHLVKLSDLNSRTNIIASRLRYNFSKELTWMALVDDGESVFRIIQEVITQLRDTAHPSQVNR